MSLTVGTGFETSVLPSAIDSVIELDHASKASGSVSGLGGIGASLVILISTFPAKIDRKKRRKRGKKGEKGKKREKKGKTHETTWKIEKLSAPNGLSRFFRLEWNGVIGVAGIRIGQNQ